MQRRKQYNLYGNDNGQRWLRHVSKVCAPYRNISPEGPEDARLKSEAECRIREQKKMQKR